MPLVSRLCVRWSAKVSNRVKKVDSDKSDSVQSERNTVSVQSAHATQTEMLLVAIHGAFSMTWLLAVTAAGSRGSKCVGQAVCSGDTGEESDGWMCDRRCCGDTGEESEGRVTVCGTDVVVILVKRVRGGSQTVCGAGFVVVLLKRAREGSQYVGQTLW